MRRALSLFAVAVAVLTSAAGFGSTRTAHAAPTTPASIRALAAATLPTDRLHFGLANQPGDFSWMQASGVPWKYRYQYLSGGVNTPFGSAWQDWNSPSGAFATLYMNDSASIGAIPVFTYYELLQSLPSTGATELDRDYSNLNSASTMLAYYTNFALLMTKAAAFGQPVVVHVEPDLFAYMEIKAGAGNASSVSASVASSTYAGLGTFPNTFQGFAWALLKLRDTIAPNVMMAIHASTWASNTDIGLNTNPAFNMAANADTVAAFLGTAGVATNTFASTFDLVFNDVADRDSGVPSSGRWWDRNDLVLPDFQQWLTWMTELHARTARQLVVWQVPVGNQYFETMNQTLGHYQDNRAEYFLSHVSALQAAGIVAVLFGSGGNDNSTTYTDSRGDGVTNTAPISTFECAGCNSHVSVWSDDDGGYLRIFVGAYYANTPMITSVAPSSGPSAGGTPVTITGTNFTGATAVKFGATTATYTVTDATHIAATSPAGSGVVNVTVTTPLGTSATITADQFTFIAPGTVYTAVTPVRLRDTRNGGTLGSGGTLNLTIGGATFGSLTVPANSNAVVLNVTATNESAAGFFTVYPAGGGLPTASNLNFAAGETVPNLVSVGLGAGGAITIYNGVGSADAVVDLEGYYAPPGGGTAGELVAVVPARITDTRTGSGQANAGMTLGAGATLDVQVTGGVIPSGVSAVVMNVTATNTSAAGFFTVYPTGVTRPLASNLNWAARVTVPNRVIVPVGTGGKVSFYNGVGSADLIVDVSGYFTGSASSGYLFRPLTPIRIVDTRFGTGGFYTSLGQGAMMVVTVAGGGGVPNMAAATPPTAVVLNVTVTGATAASDLVVWPDGGSRPVASDLNFAAGQTVPNLVIVKLSAAGKIDIGNDFGWTQVIVDVVGWYG